MKMLYNRIACIPLEDPDLSPGGIIIPERGKQRTDQGIVKYIGPDVIDVQVGDHVCFSGYTGTKMSGARWGVLIWLPEEGVDAILGRRGKPLPGAMAFGMTTIVNVAERIYFDDSFKGDIADFLEEFYRQLETHYLSMGLEF